MPPKGRGRGRGGGGNQDNPKPGQGRQGPRGDQQRPPGREAGDRQDQGPMQAPPQQQRPMQAPPQQQTPMQEQQRPKQPKQQEQQKPAESVPPQRTVDPAEELGIQFEHKAVLSQPFPPKQPSKNPGRKIRLISNCYQIDLPRGDVYHYDVEIISKRRESTKKEGEIKPLKGDKKYRCMSTKRNREVIDLMLQGDKNFKNMFAAFDGRKNLFTRKPLNIPSPPLKCNVQMPSDNPEDDRTDDFVVQIQPVRKRDSSTCAINLNTLQALFEGKINTVNQEAVMAVETILRHGPCKRFFPVGRSFFYPPAPQDVHPLGGGREIWFGYHQSLRLGQWKPMINLDITATTFYQDGPVLNYVAQLLKTSVQGLSQLTNIRDSDIKMLAKELKNLRIEVNHLRYKRKYRILNVNREGANRLTFPMTEGDQTRNVTVMEYFRTQYKKQLKFPHLPCLQGNPLAKKIFLPMEVCDIVTGQHCKKKLEERQNAEMIKFTARPPRQRFDEIKDLVKRANYTADEYLKEFGMKVYNEPLKLEGRIISPPSVRYCESQIVPHDGSWDMRGKQFFKGAEIDKWVFLSFSSPSFCKMFHLEKFAKLLVSIGNESGISFNRPALIDIMDNRRQSVNMILTNIKKKFDAELAVIVVPDRNKTIYGEIKQAAETILGLSTQCVKDSNVVNKCNPPLVSNLCQKINAKMGGVNNSLTPGETPAILRRPVLIIGADVTHPSPSQDIKPSLAAAVGSLDSHPSRYAVTCRAQTNVDERKQAIEIILDLRGMVHDLLLAFYKNTRGKKPEKIIFYRDGVSEGQFDKVRDHEVKCIREACKKIEAGYEPGITFIVVQKRHHIRFMPQDSRDGVGKMRNIPPGTTVDNTVVHPLNFDFFLCSHFGLQGTSRPAHYTVLEDDNDFSADDLHKLTYYLCHTYVRCTKSISCPAPVQYAHLAAFRARQHLLSQYDESSADSTDSSFSYHPLPETILNAIKVTDGLKNTMYFV